MKVKPRKRSGSILLFIFVFILFDAALASQEVIYKESRPLKAVSEVTKEAGKTGESYSYDPTGKIDPFKSFIAEQEEIQEKKKRKPRTYLETLDLSQLELIAIMIGPRESWAMVRDAKGLGHVIKKGTAIGTEGGVVYQIKDREVIVREEYLDFKGRTKYKDVSKKVPTLR